MRGKSMDLYNLGTVTWSDAQLIYHALPRLGREGIVLVSPAEEHLCLGMHQDAEWEVDLPFLRERGMPLFRREVGGGLVLLDRNQVFYQIVVRKDRPEVPRRSGDIYRRFLIPVLETLASYGLEPEYRPVVDLWVGGRKISGNGGGEIEGHAVVVGNILLDFNFALMARCLNLSHAALREAVERSMRQRITTLQRELRRPVGYQEVAERLALRFAELFGELRSREVDPELRAEMDRQKERLGRESWILQGGRRTPYREVKIAEGTYWREYRREGPSGTALAVLELREGLISQIYIRGPGEEILSRWATELIGRPLVEEVLREKPPPAELLSPAEARAWLFPDS